MFYNITVAQQIVINDSKLVSQSIQEAWQSTWNLAFDGNIFKTITNLGLTIAVTTLFYWIIKFGKDLLDDRSYQSFSEIIWPIIVIILLANGGQNLVSLTTGMRGIINNTNDSILTSLTSQADLQKTLDALSNYSNISSTLSASANQCYVLKPADQKACMDSVIAQAKELKSAYDSSFLDVSKALGNKMQSQIDSFSQDPIGNGVSGISKIQNTISSSVLLAVAESFMVAMQAAFQALIEVSFLLTGLMGPIAVGASLLPIGAKPFYAWLTAFWSLGIAKLSLNIVTGLVAVAVATSGQNDNLSIAITLGFLSPILALALASGGGMAIFSGIVAAASAAVSSGLNISMRYRG